MLPLGDVLERLARWTGCEDAAGSSSGETARVVVDYVRHGLCNLGNDPDGGLATAVHVHQLLGAIRRQFAGWLAEPDEPPWVTEEEADDAPAGEDPDLRVTGFHGLSLWSLRRLTLLEECAHRGRGYYLPTPARAVYLPSGTILVLAGLPTRALEASIGLKLRWAGLARVIAGPGPEWPPDAPRQSVEDWLRQGASPLPVWTDQVLSDARIRAMTTSAADASAFEIYAPHLMRNQGQKHRWVSPRSWRPSGVSDASELALCRTRARPHRFWLSPLEEDHQGARYRTESTFSSAQVRRLMYGLDQRVNAIDSAFVLAPTGGMSGERELRLYNWPAWGEYRLLQALAYDATPIEGPHLPIRFRVAQEFWPDVVSVLDRLAIPLRYDRSMVTDAR